MRILHVGKFYPPVRGGMERVLQVLVEGERRLLDARVLAANSQTRTVVELYRGVPVTRVGAIGAVGTVALAPTFPWHLARSRADVIVLHEPNPLALLSYWLVRPKGRLVVWLHSELVRHRWYYGFYGPLLKWGLRRAHAIVVASPALLDHVRQLDRLGGKCLVIPYGIEPPPAAMTPMLEPAVREVRAKYGTPFVLFVGRLVPYKGVDVLLRALSGLDATAVIIGAGPCDAELRRLADDLGITDRVHFMGGLSDHDLLAFYQACDVFVLPSTAASEAFGVVQLEAMACGKPVISTALPSGVPWVNQHEETGLVVPPGDATALRRALGRLLHDVALRQKLGDAGRRRVLERFTVAAMVRASTTLYETLTATVDDRRPARSKRIFDIAFALLGLSLASPIALAIALGIKCDDRGPIFYRQRRVGRGGHLFEAWKFRSMVRDADATFGPRQARAGDSRITRIGRVLRATAMDELPQLWNILRGDMSFVGPRALMPNEIEVTGSGHAEPIETVPGFHERHRVRPGLTGIAQIYAARDIPRRHKFRYDNLYIRSQSFSLDLRLIALSFWISVRGRWEHRGTKT